MVFDDYPLDDHSCQFQVGSCKFSMKIKNGVTSNISCFVDYDTIETVTCRSFYIYDQVSNKNIKNQITINMDIIPGKAKKSSAFYTNRGST